MFSFMNFALNEHLQAQCQLRVSTFFTVSTVCFFSNSFTEILSREQLCTQCWQTEDQVLRVLKKPKPSRSSGPDGFPSLLFKKLSSALAEPLSLLYSSFMSVGQMPSSWAHAIVTPIYKGGSASELSNYRPLSLTSVACKIMERIVVSDLLDYLRVSNSVSNHQHGFLSGRSTCIDLFRNVKRLDACH
jgi:Reverse transcriptase (RNA-dependent DNA polymerase)